jgi:hypothetical protein
MFLNTLAVRSVVFPASKRKVIPELHGCLKVLEKRPKARVFCE